MLHQCKWLSIEQQCFRLNIITMPFAMRGSWSRSKAVGYKVVRIDFENGKPTRFEDFLTGFLVDNNKSHFGRLVGVAIHPDGSLLVSDDTNGVIYRVASNYLNIGIILIAQACFDKA